MVAISTIKSSNETVLPSSIPQGLVAFFIGATSGIGQSALKQLADAAKGKSPRLYIVGRSESAAAPLLDHLRRNDDSATVQFIERDVSLLREVDAAADFLKQHERKLDLLFISAGFISFQGRIETAEGLEPSMTTRFYSRARAVQQLLPLLNNSENPHVTNIGAGGQEAPIDTDDLDLVKPGNYSIPRAAVHSTTMLTLTLEKYANENPKISFVHAFPGLTDTPTLYRGSSGISGFLLRRLVAPVINTLVSASVEDVGARALFYATNARYSAPATESLSTPIPQDLAKATTTQNHVFLVNEKSESVDNQQVLDPIRESSADAVSRHLDEVFARVL
ncbi:NmrA-like family domain-containing oxidoreductase notO [Paramyrothecium foliicola]|nr:NmrA-like family domain-containing oxidoreductase notO [Paramyrothecium foliicola]